MPRRNLRDDGKRPGASKPALPLLVPPREAPVTREWMQATGQAGSTADMAMGELERIAEPGYGRYSVNRDSNGNAYHKWRWTGGKLAGRYVMYVATKYESLAGGMLGLAQKVDAAEEGRQYATEDRYK